MSADIDYVAAMSGGAVSEALVDEALDQREKAKMKRRRTKKELAERKTRTSQAEISGNGYPPGATQGKGKGKSYEGKGKGKTGTEELGA